VNDRYIVTDDSLPVSNRIAGCAWLDHPLGPHGQQKLENPEEEVPARWHGSALQDGVSATTKAGIFDCATASEDYWIWHCRKTR
jgi:hypothetical protein